MLRAVLPVVFCQGLFKTPKNGVFTAFFIRLVGEKIHFMVIHSKMSFMS
jgi:hypothetical protein